MADTATQINIDAEVRERLMALPQVVRDSITSSDISRRLQILAQTHNLHVDQWQKLENEVMYAILGFQDVTHLSGELAKVLGIAPEEAAKLTEDINGVIFEPIREELERELGSPQAKEVAQTSVEALGEQAMAEARAAGDASQIPPTPSASPVAQPPTPFTVQIAPATPPSPPPTEKAVRAPVSAAYTSQSASHERKGIEGDPYREQIA